ncbi:hypothetical protein AB8884_03010 [Yersinia enterocolitica]|uniref:hypothetical protein n=1 Tax=Yersinia enterocolitica TaxID=630 RepID=UPI003D025743
MDKSILQQINHWAACARLTSECSSVVHADLLEKVASHIISIESLQEETQKERDDAQHDRDLHYRVSEKFRIELIASEAALSAANEMVPVTIDSGVIRDANRYRFLRDEDSWGEDSDSWDVETKTGLISSENLMELRLDHFDAAIDARMAASDIPFLNPANASQKPVVMPERYSFDCGVCADPNGEWVAVDDIKDAIKATGGTVEE